MHLAYTPEQEALRLELRRYFAALLTPEVRSEVAYGEASGEMYRKVIRQMGADGWLGIGWPKQYGGQGRSPVEQFIFYDEANRARAPVPLVTLNTVGPTLMLYGSEEQKQQFLPPILRGELHIAIGYTEPGAGTDLASLRTRAVRDGDEYVINGSKVFTTGGHDSEFIWLAARTKWQANRSAGEAERSVRPATDPDAPKHKGITIFLVDTALPGFKATPIYTLAGGRTNATFYDDVRVPASAIVGVENGGWKLITTQLNHERVAMCPPGRVEQALENVIAWAAKTERSGRRVIDVPWVQLSLARVRAKAEALKLLNWRVAWSLGSGGLNPAHASSVKVYGTEMYIQAFTLLLEILGDAGYLTEDSPDAVLGARLEHDYRQAFVGTFGGGVNEVQREIIATAGLGMPRSPR
jgi:alkylation response protein AidB-like acyl-CoA dehydrogenase